VAQHIIPILSCWRTSVTNLIRHHNLDSSLRYNSYETLDLIFLPSILWMVTRDCDEQLHPAALHLSRNAASPSVSL
jgi:hypothetical protein